MVWRLLVVLPGVLSFTSEAGGAPARSRAVPVEAARGPAPLVRLSSQATPPAPSDRPPPGDPAPPEVVGQLRTALTHAVERFQAMDAAGVLGHVSDHYRTGPLTKALLRQQLVAMFGVYDAVRARVRIDEVRMLGEQAWIASTGVVSGRVRFLGTWTDVLAWERELEVARREQGVWRLVGDQQ